MPVHERICPLCDKPATPYTVVDFGRKHLVDCDQCKAFVISPDSATEKYLRSSSSDFKCGISAKSSSLPEDRVLVISSNSQAKTDQAKETIEIKCDDQSRDSWD
jgi:hypothetical protein